MDYPILIILQLSKKHKSSIDNIQSYPFGKLVPPSTKFMKGLMQMLSNTDISNCSNGQASAVQSNQMFVEKTYHLKFTTPVSFIHEIWPAFNDSIVFRATVSRKIFVVFHLDCKGQELYRHTTYHPENRMCLIDDRKIAVTDIHQSCITIINLQSKEVRHISHEFDKKGELSNLQYNPDTKSIFLLEKFWGPKDKSTSYSLQNMQKQAEIIYILKPYYYNIGNEAMTSRVKYVGNDKVMIAIYDAYDERKEELKKERNGQPKTFEVETKIFYLCDQKIQEIGENKFLLTFRNISLFKQKRRVHYQTLVVDLQANTLRDPKFFLENKEMKFSSTVVNIGDFSVFKLYHEGNQYTRSTLYFVCHVTESLINKVYLNQLLFSIYFYKNPRNTVLLVEKKSNEKQTTNFMVTKFEVSIIKDQYLFLMLGIYDDFDDDLLYDAVDLLTT